MVLFLGKLHDRNQLTVQGEFQDESLSGSDEENGSCYGTIDDTRWIKVLLADRLP